MFIKEILERIIYCKNANRIGPDILFTHWMLHYKTSMQKLCKKKFYYFDSTAYFRPGAYAEWCSHISIGKNVVIRPNTMLFADEHARIIIEDDVLIGSGVHFYVDNHKFDNINIKIIDQGYDYSQDILLKEGSWIGANAILLPGVVIGKNSVVGAGSIVTKSVPDFCVVAGNPARVIKELQK